MLADSRGGHKGIGGRVMRSALRIMMFKSTGTLDDIGSDPGLGIALSTSDGQQKHVRLRTGSRLHTRRIR